jgi:uncharacterized membrane protein YraQ (UPF0718 family)
MTVTTAIIVNLFLLAAAVVGLVMELWRFRVVAGICMTAVLIGYSVNIFYAASDAAGPYVAHHHGNEFHATTCVTVRDAIARGDRLDPYPTAAKALEAGLYAHHCVKIEPKMYTAAETATPDRKPSTKNRYLSIVAPHRLSTGRPTDMSQNR